MFDVEDNPKGSRSPSTTRPSDDIASEENEVESCEEERDAIRELEEKNTKNIDVEEENSRQELFFAPEDSSCMSFFTGSSSVHSTSRQSSPGRHSSEESLSMSSVEDHPHGTILSNPVRSHREDSRTSEEETEEESDRSEEETAVSDSTSYSEDEEDDVEEEEDRMSCLNSVPSHGESPSVSQQSSAQEEEDGQTCMLRDESFAPPVTAVLSERATKEEDDEEEEAVEEEIQRAPPHFTYRTEEEEAAECAIGQQVSTTSSCLPLSPAAAPLVGSFPILDTRDPVGAAAERKDPTTAVVRPRKKPRDEDAEVDPVRPKGKEDPMRSPSPSSLDGVEEAALVPTPRLSPLSTAVHATSQERKDATATAPLPRLNRDECLSGSDPDRHASEEGEDEARGKGTDPSHGLLFSPSSSSTTAAAAAAVLSSSSPPPIRTTRVVTRRTSRLTAAIPTEDTEKEKGEGPPAASLPSSWVEDTMVPIPKMTEGSPTRQKRGRRGSGARGTEEDPNEAGRRRSSIKSKGKGPPPPDPSVTPGVRRGSLEEEKSGGDAVGHFSTASPHPTADTTSSVRSASPPWPAIPLDAIAMGYSISLPLSPKDPTVPKTEEEMVEMVERWRRWEVENVRQLLLSPFPASIRSCFPSLSSVTPLGVERGGMWDGGMKEAMVEEWRRRDAVWRDAIEEMAWVAPGWQKREAEEETGENESLQGVLGQRRRTRPRWPRRRPSAASLPVSQDDLISPTHLSSSSRFRESGPEETMETPHPPHHKKNAHGEESGSASSGGGGGGAFFLPFTPSPSHPPKRLGEGENVEPVVHYTSSPPPHEDGDETEEQHTVAKGEEGARRQKKKKRKMGPPVMRATPPPKKKDDDDPRRDTTSMIEHNTPPPPPLGEEGLTAASGPPPPPSSPSLSALSMRMVEAGYPIHAIASNDIFPESVWSVLQHVCEDKSYVLGAWRRFYAAREQWRWAAKGRPRAGTTAPQEETAPTTTTPDLHVDASSEEDEDEEEMEEMDGEEDGRPPLMEESETMQVGSSAVPRRRKRKRTKKGFKFCARKRREGREGLLIPTRTETESGVQERMKKDDPMGTTTTPIPPLVGRRGCRGTSGGTEDSDRSLSCPMPSASSVKREAMQDLSSVPHGVPLASVPFSESATSPPPASLHLPSLVPPPSLFFEWPSWMAGRSAAAIPPLPSPPSSAPVGRRGGAMASPPPPPPSFSYGVPTIGEDKRDAPWRGSGVPSPTEGGGLVKEDDAPPPEEKRPNGATATLVGPSAPLHACGTEDGVVPLLLSKEELAMYARYAMSSGKLRGECSDPYSFLTNRAALLRRQLDGLEPEDAMQEKIRRK